MISSASSSLWMVVIGMIGQKVSSRATSISFVTPSSKVGS